MLTNQIRSTTIIKSTFEILHFMSNEAKLKHMTGVANK